MHSGGTRVAENCLAGTVTIIGRVDDHRLKNHMSGSSDPKHLSLQSHAGATDGFMSFTQEEVEQSIPERFEKIVRMYPNRLAVKMGESLTYDELNRYANRIAHAILEKRGLGSEPIALFFEKSIELVAAIFGVLKAGKFYVVLDPSFPSERLHFLLEDSGAKLVITDQPNLAIALKFIGEDQALITTAIDDETHSSDNLNLRISPQDLAYIQYTSGSTGRPKGVILLHRMILQSVCWSAAELHVCIDDRFTLLHSLSFGSGHVNLRLALLNGASIFDFDTKRGNIERLAAWLNDERITIYHSTASLFRQLAESLPDGGMHPDLRLIRLTGAPISKRDFDLYKTRFGSNTFLRIAMGSTEMGSISICAAILNQGFSYPTEGFPIGYPSRGRTILFLDEDRRPVAPGQIGEIAVQSENLSGGYWKQPKATNEKFLPDPNGGGERIYLTGDFGLMLPHGFVVHLGRKDLMVKIRGYRVDFSEVEQALLKHPAIKDAGVRAWDHEGEDGEKYLAAYIVPRSEPQLNVSEIRQFLAAKLPDYMIPTAVQFVEALPLTNGKLDRQRLPKPDKLRPALKESYVGPRNETERKLADIWSEVLQIADIGVHDNFFDLGGHSLAAARIVSRVLAYFRVDLSLTSFYGSATLAGLAVNVENALRQESVETNLPLIAVSRRGNLPTSFGQTALWFHEQLEPGSPAYNLPSVYRLSGELDAQLLEKSINQIIARHEVLRTVFDTVDGQPVQKILPTMMIGLEPIDLTHLASEALQGSEVRRLVGVFAERSFDLTRGPLLRSSLLELDRNEHVLVVAIHHIVFDGWSIGVFVRELSQIYNNLRSGKPCPLLELSIQYADFAKWQRERLHGAKLRKSLDYWKAKLADLPALTLPTKRAKKISGRVSGGREEFEVSRELLDGLRGLANRSGTTLFMVLLAAWKITLCRYTGQTDIAIGTPVAGRSHPAVEELIGYFLNLVVLRTDLSGDPTVRELLERMRRVCVDAFAHQEVPFEKLVEELRPTRHVAANPLVQATFALQNTPKNLLNLAGITASDLDISAGILRPFDLHLYIIEEETHLRAFASYNKSWFETETIKRLINHFSNILKAIAADKDGRISALPMLTKQEKHQLLVGWNDTKAEYPKDKCIHELFEKQVEKTPDAIALVFEDRQLTYQELNNRANQLGYYLRKRRVGPEVPVGICVKRSVEMVVGLLGILKAGGAYVPLDPNYPVERLDFMLADAHVEVLLTQDGLLEEVGSRMDDGDRRSSHLDRYMERICLDGDWEQIARESGAKPEITVTADNLAYVIYTSGSTGKPKGVAIEHRNTVGFLSWVHATFTQEELSAVLAATSICFDLSVFEIFAPLTCGGTIILAENVLALTTIPNRSKVSLINTVPSAIKELLRLGAIPPSVRVINLAGEPLGTEWVRRIYESTSVGKVHDLYGPSECTTYSTWTCRTADDPQTVGRPIANTQVYIVDAYRNPVPIGVVGEIYIGGDGVARGYLHRPELTAEKFIYHSFNREAARRLYKTGDLARYLPDGNIEFLGRFDNQVKLHGYRIELGEIEAVLGQHPMVQSSVVVVREDTPGDKRLVGCVVARSDESFDIQEVRKYLKQKLPEYMIPSQFVLLDALPLTPNGKVGRKALPAPDQDRPELGNVYQAPRTPMEETLATIWSELLKVDKVGIHDNFFELGGHSLLATQVISRVRSCLSVELPLRVLFESPTIEQMAAAIMEQQEVQPGQQEHVSFELESLPDEGAQRLMAKETGAGDRHE